MLAKVDIEAFISHEVALVNSGNDINTVLVHDLVRMLHCVFWQDIVNDSFRESF